MAISVQNSEGSNLLRVALTGKLTVDDYANLVPEVDHAIAKHGKLRMLVDMHDFHGWTAGAIWEDTKFSFRHFSDIERLALVGEKSWEHGMAVFCKPFTGARVRYFNRSKAAEAEAWINETPENAVKA